VAGSANQVVYKDGSNNPAGSGNLTFDGSNLFVGGNITVGGTTAFIAVNELRVKDKDIVLGITTNASNQDVSTDITANHGGIAVASTEGSPLFDISAGLGTDDIPTKYKQIMWLKSGTLTGLNTDAWLFNYAVGVGTNQIPNGVRLAAGGMQVTDTTISTPNLNVSGISTVGFLTATNIWNAGITTSSRLTLNGANDTATNGGQIYLNGTTGNRIDFNQNGVAAPAFTTRSAGTKLVLYPSISGSAVDYAFGIEGSTLWSSIPEAISGRQHRWYGGTTQLADLKGSGEFLLGTTSLTGTASQRLQVTGGAYVSGNLGVGNTNPGATLNVVPTATSIAGLFSGTTSSDMVRITQLGSGNALVVEDSTNPDSSPFVVNASGNIGIGTNNPTVQLQLSPTASISNVGSGITLAGTVGSALTVAQFYYANTNATYLRIKATRNTTGSDWFSASTKLVNITDVTEQGYIEYNPNGALSGMAFGSGATEWARFLSSGNFGIGRTNPSSKLEVLGTIAAYSADITSVGSFAISNAGVLDIVAYKATGGTLRFVTANTSGTNLDRGRVDSSGNFIIGSTSATGTASQPLQVTGGAYVSGSVGIGTTNPGATLNVVPTATSIAGLFSGTTSSDMVCITQLGTGNALVVEDSANPDSSPFVVKGDGNLGIGTNNPTSKLDVIGDVKVLGVSTFTNANNSAIQIRSGASGSYTALGIGRVSEEGTIAIASGAGIYANNAAAGDIVIRNNNASGKVLFTRAGANASLAVDGDNVLVGTVSSTGTASQTLQVTGGAYISGNLGVGVTNPSVPLVVSGTSRFFTAGAGDVTISHSSLVSSIKGASTVQLALGANATDVIRINNSGFVGIGTTNPGATLNVVPTATSIAGLFSGTTSSDMVRITQLGSGNALVVEDSTNPDSSPFVVTGIGSVGIGTASPAFTADIAGDARVTSTNKMRFGGTAGTTNFYIQYNSTANSLDFVAG
jgi:hypothetical protein